MLYHLSTLINFSSEGAEENLLILKIENMKRLKKLLGDRPVFFGSSRKRFLKNILENSAALTAELIRDSHSKGSSSNEEKKGGEGKEEERRSPTVEELDWATAGTTAAAVTGILRCAIKSTTHPIHFFLQEIEVKHFTRHAFVRTVYLYIVKSATTITLFSSSPLDHFLHPTLLSSQKERKKWCCHSSLTLIL